MRKEIIIALAVCLIALGAFFFLNTNRGGTDADGKTTVRIGYFPNLLHGQALVAVAKDDYRKNLGPNVDVKTLTFNAGPSAIEALFANEVDIVYIGPNPTINGYVKSNGQALKIIAGAASGGAVFVLRNDTQVSTPADLVGKKLASPQLGNTQDVALRAYLKDAGLQIGEGAGKVQVVPTDNPQILTLFQTKAIDGAWVPEPWGARLVQEGGGKIFLDERELWPDGQFVTANVIVSSKFLKEHPDIVKRFLETHVQETLWINENPVEAKQLINAQIKNLTSKALPAAVLDESFSRCTLTYDPVRSSLTKSADSAYGLGFLGTTKPNLDGIYDLALLNEVLAEKGLARVQ